MTAVTIQELCQIWNLLNSIEEQEASVTISFPSVLKNGTSCMLICYKSDENSFFDIHNPIGFKPLNRRRLNFSHLNEHKFCQNFWDTVNSLCLCNAETKTTSHYLETPLKASVILTILW